MSQFNLTASKNYLLFILHRWGIKRGEVIERRIIHLQPLNIQLVPFDEKLPEVKLVTREETESRQEKQKSTNPVASSSSTRTESTCSASKRKTQDAKIEPVKSKKLRQNEPSTASSTSFNTAKDDDNEPMECNDKGESELIKADEI